MITRKYNIVYADPPWLFKTYSEKGKEKKSAENHYPTMKINDIYNLPVQNITADDCILFLWVTFPLLKEGIETMERQGFTYKTCAFNWVKKNKKSDTDFWGCGYWTRANSEICLLGTKGKPHRLSRSVHQIVREEMTDDEWNIFMTQLVEDRVMSHSKKPEHIRDKIVELCGDVPRVELFARTTCKGWDSIGNEIDGQDIRDVIK